MDHFVGQVAAFDNYEGLKQLVNSLHCSDMLYVG